jgi:hypothetical protein
MYVPESLPRYHDKKAHSTNDPHLSFFVYSTVNPGLASSATDAGII